MIEHIFVIGKTFEINTIGVYRTQTDNPNPITAQGKMGNEIEDLQEEVAGWNRCIYLEMVGLGNYWITVEDGRFATGEGSVDNPNLTLTAAAADVAQIFSGDMDAEAAVLPVTEGQDAG